MELNQIFTDNLIHREENLSEYACKTSSAIRLLEENDKTEEFLRPNFFRDSDRILHSTAYSRYMDKTQVFPMVTNDMITHRGLHVQLVSKVGRTIGRALNLNEDLIEAIGLGHDLGHVPFGHFGERVLNDICEENDIGVFIHNAQSVRVLNTLENKGLGLNLTVQVLDGILCHNGEMLSRRYTPNYDKTISDFLTEYSNCWNQKGFDKTITAMTLEGCVIRISDVIGYIGRDIEDAIILGYLKREDIPEDIVKVLGNTNASIMDTLVKDIIANSIGKPYLEFSEEIFDALKKLMDFNYKNIYSNPGKAENEERSRQLFKLLFQKYMIDLEKKEGYIYEHQYMKMAETYTRCNPLSKIVVDYIAGMTDKFFLNQFKMNFMPSEDIRY